MKKLLFALMLIAGAPAQAADMTPYARGQVTQDEVETRGDFAGAYAGVSINWEMFEASHGGSLSYEGYPIAEGSLPDINGEEAGVGFRAGYNWRLGRLYFGPVVMVDFGGVGETLSEGSDEFGASIETRMNFRVTPAAKLGIVLTDRLGAYGVAGWTFASMDVDTEAHIMGTSQGNSHNDWVNGFVYGGGVDVRIANNVAAFVEFTRTNLSDFKASGSLYGIDYTYSAEPQLDVIKAGLTYTFN